LGYWTLTFYGLRPILDTYFALTWCDTPIDPAWRLVLGMLTIVKIGLYLTELHKFEDVKECQLCQHSSRFPQDEQSHRMSYDENTHLLLAFEPCNRLR